jgi:membrane associated rhomboid family serine protease
MLFLFHCQEFSNCISDILLASVLWFLSQKISNFEEDNLFFKSWKQYFFLTALSALFGAIGHLFFDYTGIYLKMTAWVSALIAQYLLEKNILQQINTKSYFEKIMLAKCLIFITLALFFQQFSFVKASIAIGMIGLVAPWLLYCYQQNKNQSYLLLTCFLLANGLAGIAHALNVQPAPWCNGGDVAHLISCFAFWGMYEGLVRIKQDNLTAIH